MAASLEILTCYKNIIITKIKIDHVTVKYAMQFQHLFYFRSIAVSLKVSESDKGRVLFWNPLELHYLDINLLQMRNDQLDAPTQKYSAVKMY